MSSSKPPSAGSKRHGLSDSVFVSPGTKQQPLSASGTPVLENCPGNDDERERKQRRRSRVVDLQFSTDSPLSAQSPISKQAETSLPAIPQLTNAQIADHYSTCIKLSTENKITTKNVFGLHLIDYMTEILKQKDSELTNFKVAAGTLDASAKIYAVRVDAVHADVYRVLGGLGKDAAPTGSEADQDIGEGSVDSENSKRPLSKRKLLYKTIEKNLNNINVSETDRKCEVNPMFQKTATSFDECSTAGVFLTTLHTHSYLSEVLFDASVTPLPSSAPSESPSSSPVKVADLKSILLQCVEKRPICPSLSGFLFTQWTSETHNESVSALLDKFRKSDQVFDVNAEVDSDSGDYAEDPGENDFDADALDKTAGKDLGEFSEKLEACRIAPGSSRKDIMPLGEEDVGSMCLHLSVNPSEYSYFSPRTMSMWAGPEHWRFKPRHKGDANLEKVSKRKAAKKAFEINFDEEIEFELHFRTTRAATTLAKSTLESQNKKSSTLPADFHYDPDNLTRLFLKPANKLWKTAQPGSLSRHDEEVGEYDYNNPNDTSNFCPALQDADSDGDDPVDFVGQGGMFEMTANPTAGAGPNAELNRGLDGLNITTYGESNLLAEPQKVNKIDIQYAKTAKKMDMKRLKRTMWCLLTDSPKTQMEAEKDNLEKSTNSSAVAGPKIFSSITQELLHRLPSMMAKNLSVPLAFACLLHLANEKNLKLEGVEDLSEVLVLQGD
ncbi:condensin complex subunit 2 [Hemicordylus capensis]|uniref:condensin complex subunit 2 n=1 Tax=Hemicordylus capensis TaxID=884348 RepID=UPI0023032D05|nr:condensin complex subunit 2 [Hemicordylus capensis]XP_053126228.1 condensin complex subunit 2 [Hemicordylus capensis]XP_053126230.1 condensin complex subunit 2 [Hemicordylus capensis]